MVGHDEYVFAALELHDDGFEADHYIAVAVEMLVVALSEGGFQKGDVG